MGMGMDRTMEAKCWRGLYSAYSMLFTIRVQGSKYEGLRH